MSAGDFTGICVLVAFLCILVAVIERRTNRNLYALEKRIMRLETKMAYLWAKAGRTDDYEY